jgi:hypothetical protein
MKLLKKWRQDWRIKFKARIRKEYRKKFEKKLREEMLVISDSRDAAIALKDKEISELHLHYKREIEIVRTQEANKWKTLLEERDSEIHRLRKEKEERREAILKFEQMVQDFETSYTSTRVKIGAAGEYVKKAEQSLLSSSGEWDSFTNIYRKQFPKIQEQLKEN